jgi:biotin transport system ATP-binding protein
VALIEIHRLCHRFPDGTRSLTDVTLSIDCGEFVVIAGANGSGKTTLLKQLNGLLGPESGTLSVGGVSVRRDPLAVRRQVGMVFQDADSQIIGDTVYDDVCFGPENLRLTRTEIDTRARRALGAVSLDGSEDRSPHHLSGGEKRRLAIAGVLAMAPRVMLLDEPFSNLDYPATSTVLEHIRRLHEDGHTIIVTTHDLEKVISLATRLVVMAHGRVVLDGAPETAVEGLESHGIRPPCSVLLGRGIQPWLP